MRLVFAVAFVSLASVVLQVSAQDTSWMLTSDECGGFRQSPFDRAIRYAVSASTTWGGISATYDCPSGFTRAESRHARIWDDSNNVADHHLEARTYAYHGHCGWNNYDWEGGTRRYLRLKGGNYYKHTGYDDYYSLWDVGTTDSFAGVVCHLDPAQFPSWMISSDDCFGFRPLLSVPGVNLAVSATGQYVSGNTYTCPLGYRWMSSTEFTTLKSTSGVSSPHYFYYSQCGWGQYQYGGITREIFRYERRGGQRMVQCVSCASICRFNDTSSNGKYLHAGTHETTGIYSGTAPTGSHNIFGGIVCVYDETLDPYNIVFIDSCTNGTTNDPQVALEPPTLEPATISNNNYTLNIEVDRRYKDVKVIFGNSNSNPCNYEEDNVGDWYRASGATDPTCGERLTFSKNYQTMVAATGTGACQFTRTTSGNDVIFRQDVSIETQQERSIEYQQGHRNSTYTETKYTHYVIQVTVPTLVTANSASVNVTGNITVLHAVSNVQVDVSSNPYKVGFTLLASSQAPYQLTYRNFTAPTDLGTSITRASDTPACADPNFNTPCLQSFVFSDLSIETDCNTKSVLNDALTVAFDVGCKSSFSGNCATPSPAQIVVSFSLLSTQYCPTVQDVSISATLDTYADVSLSATTDWLVADKSSSFVVGATLFGQVEVTVGQNAATLASTKIRTLSTLTSHTGTPLVVYSGGSGVTGTVVEHGDTAQGGNFNWPSDNKQARFSILLANPTTVQLDPVLDAAQTVTVTAVVDVTYTTAGTSDKSPLLQQWSQERHGRVRTQAVQSSVGGASATVGVSGNGASSAAPPASSGSSAAGISTTTMVAVGAAFVVLVVAAAYSVGKRRELSALEKSTIRSSSTVEMVDVTAVDDTA